MSRCTAPTRGHRTQSGRASCPVCGTRRPHTPQFTYQPNYQPWVGVGELNTARARRPPLDKETVLGLVLFALIPIGLLGIAVAAFMPDEEPPVPAAAPVVKVWDGPSQGFLSALAAAGITPVDDDVAGSFVEVGKAMCARLAQPLANKADIASLVHQAWDGPLTEVQALAMVDAANVSFCPAALVPATAAVVPDIVPNMPYVPVEPSPPRVSSGGGGGSGGESRFCRRRWWC